MPPVISCVILQRCKSAERVLLGVYSPDHANSHLRGLYTTPQGGFMRRPDGSWEDPLDAAFREAREECGAAPGDLRPVACETFRSTIFVASYGTLDVAAVLFEARRSWEPQTMLSGTGKIGEWGWYERRHTPPVLATSIISTVTMARFGWSFGW